MTTHQQEVAQARRAALEAQQAYKREPKQAHKRAYTEALHRYQQLQSRPIQDDQRRADMRRRVEAQRATVEHQRRQVERWAGQAGEVAASRLAQARQQLATAETELDRLVILLAAL